MALRTGLRASALVALIAVAGCGGGDSPAPAPPGAPVFKPVAPTIPATLPTPPPGVRPGSGSGTGSEPMAMVTDLASGWPITLPVGQSMAARLTADRAAGLRWSLRPGSDGGVLKLTGEPAYETTTGSPGVEVFRLVAVKPGQTTLTFDYRKDADAVPIRSVSYPVTVQ